MTKTIALANGAECLVDDENYEALNKHVWHLGSNGYATRGVGRVAVRLHRVVAQAPEGLEVDHINGDKLDNRKENLRVCLHQQNACNRSAQANNTSGRKGVSWHKQARLWAAKIRAHGKDKHLGLFADLDDAARAYDAASKALHGEFGRHNGLDGVPVTRRRHSSNNKSGLAGVYPRRKVWGARCSGKHLGNFPTKLAAAVAYNIAALRAFGFDAYQNDVFSGEVV